MIVIASLRSHNRIVSTIFFWELKIAGIPLGFVGHPPPLVRTITDNEFQKDVNTGDKGLVTPPLSVELSIIPRSFWILKKLIPH